MCCPGRGSCCYITLHSDAYACFAAMGHIRHMIAVGLCFGQVNAILCFILFHCRKQNRTDAATCAWLTVTLDIPVFCYAGFYFTIGSKSVQMQAERAQHRRHARGKNSTNSAKSRRISLLLVLLLMLLLLLVVELELVVVVTSREKADPPSCDLMSGALTTPSMRWVFCYTE